LSVILTRGLKKHFGAHEVLRGVDLAIEAGEKIGCVGRNGGGKTTLLRIAAGLEVPDEGEVQISRQARTGYVSQRPHFEPLVKAFEYVEGGLAEVKALLAEARDLEAHLSEFEGDALDRAVERFSHVTETIEHLGGWHADRQVELVLDGIGLGRHLWEREARSLSGGEKARVAMARELVRRPDLLMLDEPTNHLDLEGIEWLEAYLKEFAGALLLVSHDRRMLDRVTTAIVELEWGKLRRYPGNYDKYVQLREERFTSEMRAWEIQQDYLRKEETFIKKHMGSQRTAEAKGRQKKLENIERLVRPWNDVRRPVLRMGAVERTGEYVVKTEGLAIGYPGNVLHRGLDIRIARGDKIALVGPNGAGKTTLMKTLAARMEPVGGEVTRGHKATPGYFDQETSELDPSSTPFTTMRRDHPTATDEEIRGHLAKFLFRGQDVEATVGSLSGGERMRLALARLVWWKPTWLALDEPTNHLDLAARTALEEMLSAYGGALLCISHDREFMDNLCTQVWELAPGGLRVFPGNYTAYRTAILAERDASQLADRAKKTAAPVAKAAVKSAPASTNAPKDAAKPNGAKDTPKEAPKEAPSSKPASTKVRNPFKFEQLEREIIALEDERTRLGAEMLEERVYRDASAVQERQYRLAEIERDLEEKNTLWENWS
jgi:ATP-binding cassette subfamily F protein 3